MLAVFTLGLAGAGWLHWTAFAGLAFVTGSAAAARYARTTALMTVAVSPPLLFFAILVCVQAMTATGHVMLSTIEGVTLTLAEVAPWLFAGTALCLTIAWFRGLPRCIAGLRRPAPQASRRSPTTAE